ncbi:hypothetical protein SPRG_01241 [Saprolegnia parasitica CBS 223.65]|uniref:Zinc/iron permease n=1 Tax=Saprolegnia parasitica (strain CBS 223.65) TaxID=695850 RepID=A0A067CTW0_SAPPC|nr:hypothetical protein SPRG_01241 [Saprolegnia parasitica CBS 223.65]KDO33963.1 hypothetical protein SPRG_01241 [Saprolegnia parasitica CBS 223.65]|eukprot:XP_012194856.1 hypothetical protein SPRG_01241 [Saprolegnia parasitica CBS 223.65]
MVALGLFKLASSAIIFSLALGGGLFPLYCVRPDSVVHSVLNMAAGGIFLAGSFVHLLPDALENAPLAALGCPSTATVCFPFACFFYGLGFALILLVEGVAHAAKDRFLPHSPASASELLPLHVKTHTEHDDDVTHAHSHNILDTPDTTAASLAIFVALSFHSLMEGIGIGAAPESAWNLLLAIVAHKSLAAMALTLELQHHNVSRAKIVLSLAVFGAMSPVGIGLGYVLAGANPAESLASGICTALAGGTFLYVGAMEVLPQELRNKEHLGLKLTAFLIAFGLFAALALWV